MTIFPKIKYAFVEEITTEAEYENEYEDENNDYGSGTDEKGEYEVTEYDSEGFLFFLTEKLSCV